MTNSGQHASQASDRPAHQIPDEQAVDMIATMLGTTPEWPTDFLERIADIIATTGRPHPGDQDPDEYRLLLAEHQHS